MTIFQEKKELPFRIVFDLFCIHQYLEDGIQVIYVTFDACLGLRFEAIRCVLCSFLMWFADSS